MDQHHAEATLPIKRRPSRGRPISSPHLPTTWPGRFQLVETYLESGLSAREFSTRRGIGQSTLAKWQSAYKKRAAASPPPSAALEFVELGKASAPARPSANESAQELAFVLELCNGRRLHLPFVIGDDYSGLHSFIAALEAC